MVRLSDLPDYEREHLLSKNDAPLGPTPWVQNAGPLAQKRIALITTAGLHFRDDAVFQPADATYRVIPGDADESTLVMSHSSANFDRLGFMEDLNVVFPVQRFRELVERGVIGSLGSMHYSFMGAGLLPKFYEASVRSLAGMLKQDKVDAVFLTPV